MAKYRPILLFLVSLLITAGYYDYQHILLKRPQSVHKWRQSDCASLALNYFQSGMHFFQPETNNLTSDGGKSGKAAPSEIPILYFVVAWLYKVFGYHEYVYRIFNTLLFFLGLFYLFRILFYLTHQEFWSIALTLLIFTSPALIFYGNNFLTNSASLAFSIAGLYYYLKYYFESQQKWIILSFLFFLFATAFKITALIGLFGISAAYLLRLFNHRDRLFDKNTWSRAFRIMVPVVFTCTITGGWIAYAIIYNHVHDCYYFSTTAFPIWGLSGSEIIDVLRNIKNLWLDQYFHGSVIFFLALCLLALIVSHKKAEPFLLIAFLIATLEAFAFILLQFWTLADHDYYLIDLFIIPILLLINISYLLSRQYKTLTDSRWLKLAFVVFLFFNIHYGHMKILGRYSGWMNDYPSTRDFYTITPYLRQLGIGSNDTVISIPDISHASLYLMNLKGWTEYTDAKFNRENSEKYNQDSSGIVKSIQNGARFLIVYGLNELVEKPYLQNFATNLVGNYNNVMVFDLSSRNNPNYHLPKPTIQCVYFCDAEITDTSRNLFIDPKNPSITFANAGTVSRDLAKSGSFACKLNQNSPFGMTLKIMDVEKGALFDISVWRKSNPHQLGTLVTSVEAQNPYYNSNYSLLEVGPFGWEKIGMKYYVTQEYAGKELVIYLYNPDMEPVYFDDLQVVRYKPLGQ